MFTDGAVETCTETFLWAFTFSTICEFNSQHSNQILNSKLVFVVIYIYEFLNENTTKLNLLCEFRASFWIHVNKFDFFKRFPFMFSHLNECNWSIESSFMPSHSVQTLFMEKKRWWYRILRSHDQTWSTNLKKCTCAQCTQYRWQQISIMTLICKQKIIGNINRSVNSLYSIRISFIFNGILINIDTQFPDNCRQCIFNVKFSFNNNNHERS